MSLSTVALVWGSPEIRFQVYLCTILGNREGGRKWYVKKSAALPAAGARSQRGPRDPGKDLRLRGSNLAASVSLCVRVEVGSGRKGTPRQRNAGAGSWKQ